MLSAFEQKGLLLPDDRDYQLTPAGSDWFTAWGLDLTAVHHRRRTFARRCLDWSERHPHLAGSLGAAVAQRFFELRWIVRLPESRAVRVTDLGRTSLERELQLRL